MAHDINRAWYRIRGKEDPYLKIGEENDRSKKGSSEYVWALRDINFEVQQGEVLGIIGRNGAGKSTLLKILSRTTSPTTGEIKIKGRVASLLEVGTGFHPELTGRENIFLNGAILGMTKKEIKSKFDEIVDFAGVERYIDTPVKRYSSGMYVRLAFGVAAHLEPEILIVDEVLAVGDAEFQKKALGKMKDVSGREGRTVLFVSHSMVAIKNLCNTGIFLKNGKIKTKGDVENCLEEYQLDLFYDDKLGVRSKILDSKNLFFEKWFIESQSIDSLNHDTHSIYSGEIFTMVFELQSAKIHTKVELGLIIRNLEGSIIFSTHSRDYGGQFFQITEGKYQFKFNLRLPIRSGAYQIDITIADNNKIIDQWISKTELKILSKYNSILRNNWQGLVTERANFKFEKI
jgi:lipopolysaccharide transport system ATP-binding protein